MSNVTIVTQQPGPPAWVQDLDTQQRETAQPSSDIPAEVAALLAMAEALEHYRFFSVDPRQMPAFIDQADKLLPELLKGLQRLNKAVGGGVA